MKKALIIYLYVILSAICVNAQSARQYIREGNRSYMQKQYDKAETAYRKAISLSPENSQAHYNLGCAFMMQEKDSMAVQEFQSAAKLEKDNHRRAMVYHNIGVVMQNHQQYQPAIEVYKESLRCNPNSSQTRYNLALCQKLQKNSPKDDKKSAGDKNNKQNKQQKDSQEKNQKPQDKNKDDSHDKSEEQQDKSEMSRDNAERLLNAAIQEEQQTKKKMNKMARPQQRQLRKNW